MARTIAEIKSEMIAAKEANSNLDELTSTSATAVWNLIFFIIAVSISFFESLFDLFKEDIEERAAEIPVGTLRWYAAESLIFQTGDTLELINGNLTYSVIDEDLQIVKLAAASVENSLITIKAATINSGVAEPLTGAQITALEGYWLNKRFAGEAIQIRSANPDLMHVVYTIKVNASIIDPSSGVSMSSSGTFPVEEAINTFLQTFQTVNFNGDMQISKMTNAIQAVSGVLNATPSFVNCKPDGGSYINVLALSDQTYETSAGYMAIDPTYPLSSTLVYTV